MIKKPLSTSTNAQHDVCNEKLQSTTLENKTPSRAINKPLVLSHLPKPQGQVTANSYDGEA